MDEDLRQLCNRYIDDIIAELSELGKHIFNTSEGALQEYESCNLLCEFMKAHDFSMERNVGKLPTSFKAQYKRGVGPTIAVLAEYDTIDSLGIKNQNHLTSICAAGCALVIRKMLEEGKFSGTIEIYGTPAKGVNLGKPIMLEHGAFDDVDAVFVARASDGPTRIAQMSENFKSSTISFKKKENSILDVENAITLFEQFFSLLQNEIMTNMADVTLSINKHNFQKQCQIDVISKNHKDVISIEKKIRETARAVGVISECRAFMEKDNDIVGRVENETLNNLCLHEFKKYDKTISTIANYEKEIDDLGCISRIIPTCCLYFNTPSLPHKVGVKHDLIDEVESMFTAAIKILTSTMVTLFTNKEYIIYAKEEVYGRQKEELMYGK